MTGGTNYGENNSLNFSWETGKDGNAFSSERFYSSIVHEGGHLSDANGSLASYYAARPYNAITQIRVGAFQEYSATLHEMNNQYYNFFSTQTKGWIGQRAAQWLEVATEYGF